MWGRQVMMSVFRIYSDSALVLGCRVEYAELAALVVPVALAVVVGYRKFLKSSLCIFS